MEHQTIFSIAVIVALSQLVKPRRLFRMAGIIIAQSNNVVILDQHLRGACTIKHYGSVGVLVTVGLWSGVRFETSFGGGEPQMMGVSTIHISTNVQ